MNRLWIGCLLGLALASHACLPVKKKHGSELSSVDYPVQVRPEALNSDTQWTYFSGAAQDPIYQGYIKFSLIPNAKGQWTTLLWHPASFTFHADYLQTQPEFLGLTPKQIDAISLQTNGRRVLLGTLLFPTMAPRSDRFASLDIQLMSHDPLTADTVRNVFSVIGRQLPPSQLFYKPVPEQFAYVNQESAAFEKAGIAMSNRSSSLARFCYNPGWGVGRVRVIPKGQLDQVLADGTLTSEDILVIDEVPRELPLVAGIVVSQTSSPSSHPALLAGMLGIPFVYEKDATTMDSWKQLAASNSMVYFQAKAEFGNCNLTIRSGDALTVDEAARLQALKKPLPLDLGMYDSSLVTPVDLGTMGMKDALRIGAKAANVAELRRLIPENTVTDALALPLGLFAQAMSEATTAEGKNLRSEVDIRLSALLQNGVSGRDTIVRLTEIRQLIENAQLSATTTQTILQGIEKKFAKGTKIKLRSSSNIEDHPEFNGAGLYESKGACVGDDTTEPTAVSLCGGGKRDPVIKTVQYVWGSLYTLKAWVARRYFGVDEVKSAMGVLVQASFKGELANGVAISGYPAADYSGDGSAPVEIQSTGFPGEDDSVTNPPAGKVPETALIRADAMELQIASTEVPRGRMLLTPAQYTQLYQLLTKVHAAYEKALAPKDKSQFKLDFEWKLMKKDNGDQIVIKQVRPVPMKISSTQGLDRGSLLVGEHKASLCATPMENDDALAKLQLSRPFEINIGLHEVPLVDAATMPNPIIQLSTQGQTIPLPAQARITYTPWEKVWATQNERRNFTVSVPVLVDQAEHILSWNGRQERSVAQARLLLQNTEAFWTQEISLQKADKLQNYQVILGGGTCEGDAQQGFQAGSFIAASNYGKERAPPVSMNEPFQILTGSVNFQIDIRSGFQGFDKTRFKQLDRTVIKGLLAKDIVITDSQLAVFAPSHHNFSSGYAFAVSRQPDLTAEDKAALKAKGVRDLVLMFNPVQTDKTGKASYDVMAYDDAGQAKNLGLVQRDSDF